MIVTDDPVLARSMARLRVHGMEPKYHHHEVGINSRLDAIQAAVLRVKLRRLEEWTLKRREAAGRYQGLFEAHGLTKVVGLPRESEGYFHVYNQYVIRVPALLRDPLREYLSRADRHGDLLPDPAALAGLFRAIGSQGGRFPQSRNRPPEKRSPCPSILSSAMSSSGSSSVRSGNTSMLMPTPTSRPPIVRPERAC